VVRPRKCRMVDAPPDVTYFKPRGVPLGHLNEIHLSVEGYEALRLADYQGLTHEQAAVQMQVSRQTFGRIVSQARQAVAKALVFGSALRIRGGDYAFNIKACSKNRPLDNLSMAQRGETASTDSRPLGKKEAAMPKIAITCDGPTLDDAIDPRFGRAAGFIIVDPQTLEFVYLDNGSSQAMAQGAGIQAAENVANSGAKVVLTGYVGPKAFKALQAVGIKVVQNLENMTVRQAVAHFNSGPVEWAGTPNRMGHGK
jgi:predicted DNA-binding protein (UPF0251 family)/predicted Fe-Mo cluster-binding NifX family protein